MNKGVLRILLIIFLLGVFSSIFVYADWFKGAAETSIDTGGGMKFQAQVYRTSGSNYLGTGHNGSNNLSITIIDSSGRAIGNASVNFFEAGDTLNLIYGTESNSEGMVWIKLNTSYQYDIHSGDGRAYSVQVPNNVILQNFSGDTSNMTVNLTDPSGSIVTESRAILIYKNGTENGVYVLACGANVNNVTGKLVCELDDNGKYDVFYTHSSYSSSSGNTSTPYSYTYDGILHLWKRGVSFNSPLDENITEQNATLNITLKDNNGALQIGKEINVTVHGSNNLSCRGNTDSNGQFTCGLDASYMYDIKVPSGAKYTNVSVTNEFVLEDRATPVSITFAKLGLTVRNRYGTIIIGERVDVSETGNTYLACRGTSSSTGMVYCGLDRDKTYDVMMFNVSLIGIANTTVKRGVTVPNNISVSPIVSDVLTTTPPTIVTLQGKLTDTSGTTVDTGSMYIEILGDGDGNVKWSGTFNDVLDSGVFNIGLGTLTEMYLARDERYRIVIRIDVNSATYSTADLTFGDNDPSGDLIKFVP